MSSVYDDKIRKLLSEMTLKEKIGQMNQMWFRIEEVDTIKERIRKGEYGSIILCNTAFAGSDECPMPLREFLNEIQEVAVKESRLGIPILYGRDIIHGHKTVLPVPLALSASFDPELVREAYNRIAKEAYNDGVRWTFAPMLDVARDPRWGRVIEGPGEDPYLGSRMAEAVVKGFQDKLPNPGGLAACAKHFLGYGGSEGGRDYHKCEFSEYSLRNYHLSAFKAATDAGVLTMMSAFNEISGQPISSSEYWLTDVLRGELGFEGMVVSDWDSIMQLQNQGIAENDKQCAEMSVKAGIDMEMVDRCYINNLEELVAEGKVSEELIDRAVYRILKTKFEMGLFDRPYTELVDVDFDESHKFARRLAEECMVLLKNENNTLPIESNTKVYLTGNMADEKRMVLGSWVLDGDATKTVTVRMGLENNGFKIVDNPEEADVIIAAMGESHLTTGEKHSLANIDFPNDLLCEVKELYSIGKPIIGALFFGRPRGLEYVEKYFTSMIYCWHSGSQCGNALADILSGKINPSGKLPMTLPRTTGQIPIYYNCPPAARNVNEYYAEEPGYIRNYLDISGLPMYPFGYGLSYTKFEYSDLTAEKTESGYKVSVKVKNIGSCCGTETAQCYIRDLCASMTRPMRELKGFERVILEPNEEKTVEFNLNGTDFGFYNGQNKFVVEPGDFEIYAGSNCLCRDKVKISI